MAKNQVKYPIGIQSFETIRRDGYLYVDKTKYIHNMVSTGKYYFLSRPRRFGKSLLLSTIEAYFLGRRDLFKGLALDSLTADWEKHPVLHLDLNADKFDTSESLETFLSLRLTQWERQYGAEVPEGAPISYRFGQVIRAAAKATGRGTVILIDEYDKPMLNAISDKMLANNFRDTLKAFYANLKSMDSYIKFAMLTGVARFSKVSIFSDLNNLNDITFDPEYSAICGITTPELEYYFVDSINNLASKLGKTRRDTLEELRSRYDGYHFARDLNDVYNPFCLVNVFTKNYFSNYWFNSGGTPAYLMKILRKSDRNLRVLEGCKIKSVHLSGEGIMSKDPISSLYQTGYLTIKEYCDVFDTYTLGYPNREVEQCFFDGLMPVYFGEDRSGMDFDISGFVEYVHEGKPEKFMKRLSALLAGVPHYGPSDPYENQFQNCIYILFKLVGFYTKMEDHTSDGRIDLTVETGNYVYIFEFKVDKSAREAMEQILTKEYWRKFEAAGKRIFLVAANFNSKTHRLDDILIS